MKTQIMRMVHAIMSDRFIKISSGQATQEEILELFNQFNEANDLLLNNGEQGFLDKNLKPEFQVTKLFEERIDLALATV